jgi:hypothetical protein
MLDTRQFSKIRFRSTEWWTYCMTELVASAATRAAYRLPFFQWIDCLRIAYEIKAHSAAKVVGGPRRPVLSLERRLSVKISLIFTAPVAYDGAN